MTKVILFGVSKPSAPKLFATTFFVSERKLKGRLYLTLNFFKALGLL
ncbi:hypothetical protein N9E35_01670 [Candidatus Marinimicrobia bacterium]|jgi:hypothetical protein|nr:hypothetical protein [Candidatus Neomarinimicrobiota bacterium]